MLLVEDLGRAFRSTDSGFQAQCIVYSLGLGCKFAYLQVCDALGTVRGALALYELQKDFDWRFQATGLVDQGWGYQTV